MYLFMNNGDKIRNIRITPKNICAKTACSFSIVEFNSGPFCFESPIVMATIVSVNEDNWVNSARATVISTN